MKKTLAVILVCGSISVFAQIGDGINLTNNLQNLYKKFNFELSEHKIPNKVTTSITFFNSHNIPLNSKLTNADAIDATIGANKTEWSTFNFSYILGKDEMQNEQVFLSYIKKKHMPMGGYLSDSDVDNDVIIKNLEDVRSQSPKYSSNQLYSVSISSNVSASGADVIYSYKFKKKDSCYVDLYSSSAKKVVQISEVECDND